MVRQSLGSISALEPRPTNALYRSRESRAAALAEGQRRMALMGHGIISRRWLLRHNERRFELHVQVRRLVAFEGLLVALCSVAIAVALGISLALIVGEGRERALAGRRQSTLQRLICRQNAVVSHPAS